jgi:Bacteriophage lambda head decoration protein D
MTTLYEPNYEAEWLLQGEGPLVTREGVTVTVSGTTPWLPGQILGRITATGKYVKYAPGATDGSQNAVAVLWSWMLPTAGDVRAGALLRHAEVNSVKLIGLDAAAITSLATKGIVVREGTPVPSNYFQGDYVAAGYVV